MADAAKIVSVPAATLTRNFGRWQDQAAVGPVYITHHGRPRVVLLSVDAYARMDQPAEAAANGDPTTLLDEIIEGFIALDFDLVVREVNATAARHLGRLAGDIVGQPLASLTENADNPVIDAYLRRAGRGGEIVAMDTPSLFHPGESLRVRAFPHGGGIGCLFRNVSGERTAAAATTRLLGLGQAMAAHGGVGTAQLTNRGAFASVDDATAVMLGVAAARLEKTPLVDILAIGSRVAARMIVEEVLTGGIARGFDSCLITDGCDERPVRIALAALRDGFAIEGAALVLTPL